MKHFMKLMVFVALLIAARVGYAGSQLSGTLNNPDGTGFNGTLYLSLLEDAAISTAGSCGGPVLVVPTQQVMVKIVNGAISNGPITLYGSDCTLPQGIPYVVVAKDNNGNTLFTDEWMITGTVSNLGTEVSVSPTSQGGLIGVSDPIIGNPAVGQTVTQPAGTYLSINNLDVTGTLVLPSNIAAGSANTAVKFLNTPTNCATAAGAFNSSFTEFAYGTDAFGNALCSQPNFGQLSGSVQTAQLSYATIITSLGYAPLNPVSVNHANGEAGLDVNGFVPLTEIPQLPISQVTGLAAALAAGGGSGGGGTGAGSACSLLGCTMAGEITLPDSNQSGLQATSATYVSNLVTPIQTIANNALALGQAAIPQNQLGVTVAQLTSGTVPANELPIASAAQSGIITASTYQQIQNGGSGGSGINFSGIPNNSVLVNGNSNDVIGDSGFVYVGQVLTAPHVIVTSGIEDQADNIFSDLGTEHAGGIAAATTTAQKTLVLQQTLNDAGCAANEGAGTATVILSQQYPIIPAYNVYVPSGVHLECGSTTETQGGQTGCTIDGSAPGVVTKTGTTGNPVLQADYTYQASCNGTTVTLGGDNVEINGIGIYGNHNGGLDVGIRVLAQNVYIHNTSISQTDGPAIENVGGVNNRYQGNYGANTNQYYCYTPGSMSGGVETAAMLMYMTDGYIAGNQYSDGCSFGTSYVAGQTNPGLSGLYVDGGGDWIEDNLFQDDTVGVTLVGQDHKFINNRVEFDSDSGLINDSTTAMITANAFRANCLDPTTVTGTSLTITQAGNATSGSTIYTGTFPAGGSNAYAGQKFFIQGFDQAANNGIFSVTASTTTTLTLSNAGGVADTHAATGLTNYTFGCDGVQDSYGTSTWQGNSIGPNGGFAPSYYGVYYDIAAGEIGANAPTYDYLDIYGNGKVYGGGDLFGNGGPTGTAQLNNVVRGTITSSGSLFVGNANHVVLSNTTAVSLGTIQGVSNGQPFDLMSPYSGVVTLVPFGPGGYYGHPSVMTCTGQPIVMQANVPISFVYYYLSGVFGGVVQSPCNNPIASTVQVNHFPGSISNTQVIGAIDVYGNIVARAQSAISVTMTHSSTTNYGVYSSCYAVEAWAGGAYYSSPIPTTPANTGTGCAISSGTSSSNNQMYISLPWGWTEFKIYRYSTTDPSQGVGLLLDDVNNNGTNSYGYSDAGTAVLSSGLPAEYGVDTSGRISVAPFTPVSGNNFCNANEITHDDAYIYVCNSGGVFKKVAIN
jgi:hypothetical protein